MTTSNKLLIGFFSGILISILTFLVFARINAEVKENYGVEEDEDQIKGSGRLGKETRTVPAFTGLVLHANMDVELTTSVEGVEIEAEDNLFAQIVTEVNDGNLQIHWKRGQWVDPSLPIKIKVPLKSLSSIELRGAGFITSTDTLQSDSLKLYSEGNGDLSLAIKVGYLSANISRNGDMDMEGTADQLDLVIHGSGDFNAFALSLQEASIHTEGPGGAKLQVEKQLKATTNGPGHIKYKGPAMAEKTIDHGGRLIHIQ
ncbi:MAG: head GIN domain-containing protein [Saprospiraceae bacterium]